MSEEILNEEIEEVSEIDTEERERIEREQERLEQERIDHENMLKSFPEGTIFYQYLIEEDGYKWLTGTTDQPSLADQLGFLENHYNFSELTLKKGVFYLKGYEKPDETEQDLIEQKINEIDSQLEQYMDNKVHVEKNYKNIESCISYFNSTDDEFRSNARAALRWRDDIYKVGREVRDKVMAGELDWHEIDMQYILDRVDPLEW